MLRQITNEKELKMYVRFSQIFNDHFLLMVEFQLLDEPLMNLFFNIKYCIFIYTNAHGTMQTQS